MLVIKNLSKSYGSHKKAVDNFSLHVHKGDCVGFIGHNGAGKTTTLKCIVGLLPFEQGEIRIGNHSIKEEALLCKEVFAYIPDNPELYENITGYQYLYLLASVFKLSDEKAKEKIKKYSDAFEITNVLNQVISSYSHGMKQKLVLIGALMHDPQLLIMDEPFVGLDPKATVTIKRIMNEFCMQGGSILFSTHVLDVAEKLCNQVVIIKDGKKVASGSMDEIKGNESLEDVFMEIIDNE